MYGRPMSMMNVRPTLSASNSSSDFNSLKNHGKKRNSMQQQQHQRMKKSYYTDNSNLSTDDSNKISLDKIIIGEDLRTTIMVRNVPNKYNQFEMLKEINKHH